MSSATGPGKENRSTCGSGSPTIPEEVYEVRIAMVEETGPPALNLGISGADERKRCRLGTVRIDNSVVRG